MAGRRSSLPGRLVTLIGLSFFSVELVLLAVFTGFYWSNLRAERQADLARYASAIRERVRQALRRGCGDEAMDVRLDAAVSRGRPPLAGGDAPGGLPAPPETPVAVWVFTGEGPRRFDPSSGQLLAGEEAGWSGPWPAGVRELLEGQADSIAPSEDDGPLSLAWQEGIYEGGSETVPRGVLVLRSSLRDVQLQVARYGLVAFSVGSLALLVSALLTIGALRRGLLRPLARMIEADNAARRGDERGALIDPGDIPDDEVGAIMRSRNRLFQAMTRAHRSLDEKNAELEAQREELRAWGNKLEGLVEEKTSALLRARERLHKNEKLAALGRLAANVAHEINNPLASIAGYAEMAQEELAGASGSEREALAQALRIIEEQAFRCKEILKRLLGLARSEPQQHLALALGELTRETVALCEPGARKRGVALHLELPPDGGPQLASDPVSLQQVIMNLVENALDASSRGTPGARVTVGIRADDSEEVELTVSDSGPGIPPELRERVFDPFYTTKPVGRGTGLGLAICHSLVEQLGGRIKVGDAPGGGAAFTVTLPRGDVQAAATRLVDHSGAVERQARAALASADPEE